MLKYAAKRVLLTIPVLFGISILAFLIIYVAPGDFLDLFRLTDISREQLEEMSKEFGLDQPFVIHYGRWLGQILSGSFGLSWVRTTCFGSSNGKSRVYLATGSNSGWIVMAHSSSCWYLCCSQEG